MKTPAWQKPLHWWTPWRSRAVTHEWKRQLKCVTQTRGGRA